MRKDLWESPLPPFPKSSVYNLLKQTFKENEQRGSSLPITIVPVLLCRSDGSFQAEL